MGSHDGTYAANVVACAAAKATLRVIQEKGLVPNAEAMGQRLCPLFDELKGVRISETSVARD